MEQASGPAAPHHVMVTLIKARQAAGWQVSAVQILTETPPQSSLTMADWKRVLSDIPLENLLRTSLTLKAYFKTSRGFYR